MKTKILTNIYYKPNKELIQKLNSDDTFIPINCGNLRSVKTGLKRLVFEDDYLLNISSLNPKLNEFTSIYLAYLNPEILGEAEYVGFAHYRRFLDVSQMNLDSLDAVVAMPISVYGAMFQNGSLVKYPVNMRQAYKICHSESDYDLMMKLLLSTKTYDEDTLKRWENIKALIAPCNLFVMRRDMFNEFVNKTWPIIQKLCDLIDIDGRDNYQKRALAFLSERLLSIYIFSNVGKKKIVMTKCEYHEDWKPETANDKRGEFSK